MSDTPEARKRPGPQARRDAAGPSGRAPPDAARGAAVDLLGAMLGEGRTMAELAGPAGPLARLPDPADRARAQRLALATLRHLARADRILKPHLRRAPSLRVQNLLRLATVEMLAEGAPPHGAVGAAVALARADRDTMHAAGMVNAVLRKVSGAGEDWLRLPVQELPGWLKGRLSSAYGSKAVAAIEAAHAAGAPLDLTPKDGDAAALARRLGGAAAVTPTGSVRLAGHDKLTDLPGYAEGSWWVQDAAAALPARILAPQPGERILDLCAAPGGKTLQLAAVGAGVTAVDLSPDRLQRLRENLGRTGLEAEVVVADARTWRPAVPPDAILLDAPCTATGTIRRHPELPHVRKPSDLAPLVSLQAGLLDHALSLLAPGGRLVYCTCSLLPEEGERQVAGALARHPGLRIDSAALLVPGVDPEWIGPEGGLRLRPDFWPGIGGMDGFYVAVLRQGA